MCLANGGYSVNGASFPHALTLAPLPTAPVLTQFGRSFLLLVINSSVPKARVLGLKPRAFIHVLPLYCNQGHCLGASSWLLLIFNKCFLCAVCVQGTRYTLVNKVAGLLPLRSRLSSGG